MLLGLTLGSKLIAHHALGQKSRPVSRLLKLHR